MKKQQQERPSPATNDTEISDVGNGKKSIRLAMQRMFATRTRRSLGGIQPVKLGQLKLNQSNNQPTTSIQVAATQLAAALSNVHFPARIQCIRVESTSLAPPAPDPPPALHHTNATSKTLD